jgi:hypothetical protein
MTTTLSGGLNTTPEQLSVHLNRGEMALVLILADHPERVRSSIAEAARGRGRAEALRFAHSAEMVLRLPETFILAADTGCFSVAHLALVRGRIQRHLVSVDPDQVDTVTRILDSAVDAAVSAWLRELSRSAGVVHLKVLQDLVDAVLVDVAGPLVEATEAREADSAELTRKGTALRLNCGSETTAAATWDAITQKALGLHGELKTAAREVGTAEVEGQVDAATPVVPTLSECRARVLLDLLGDTPETMNVQVNLYRMTQDGQHGTGPGYVSSVGWVPAQAADALESVAVKTVVLEDLNDVLFDESEGYRFPFAQKLQIEGRDGFCRFPGCDVPAHRCDHDHIVPSAHTDPESDGPTSVANGMSLCRRHHVLKTNREWMPSTPDGGYTVEWEGPDGQRFTTCATGPLAQVMRSRPVEVEQDPDPPD